MIARHGTPPRAGVVYRRRPGAYAVLVRGARLLLTVQQTPEGPDIQLPGGGIDPGESPIPALLREVREETGHSARILRHLGGFREYTFMTDYGFHAEKVCNVYLGQVGLRLGAPSEPGHSDLWLRPQEALAVLPSPGGRRILARWLAAGGIGRR
ncbi:NUDIX domain-containing protein [Jannaschia pohangensis]|uniref:8-oxo-dGTP diphosphatase n=1 Tax=Jannaschia pohangensis TaxID=390807 RepID=A0A1I3U9L7_9RHOB|nr:NUDIX domain-containing protein [Jannaschia pohangensis]SFJ79710.1 8-oxo-dGTP diphosphatase [Jannaschia pohangensis]